MQKASVAALFFVSAAFAGTALPIGCGSGDADSLFTSEDDPNPTATSGGTGGDATASSTTTAGPGGAGGSGQGGGGATSSSTSGTPVTSSSTTSGNGGAGGAGGAGGSGQGGGPVGVTVPCGGQECPIDDQGACCWSDDANNGQCVQGSPDNDGCDTSLNGQQTRIECATGADCATGLCCGDRMGQGMSTFYFQLTCQDQCGDITMCDTPGEMAPDCPMIMFNGQPVQAVCKQSGLLPMGYLVCGTP